ncbi:hypothetical protein L1049_009168 [Liquidambar formosana]|uniref:Uncharacterized protein n=1 Tax=Liquidambar formosana TaxID=63359 RepID=A0AAP0SAY9_LIQFO
MGEVEKNDAEVHDLRLIDFSCEDDGLIASSSDAFHHRQSSENQKEHSSFDLLDLVEATNVEDIADVPGQSEQIPQPSESLEPERTRKSGKCNLRKSLAWDSAFFTNAGVLDPDELSTMMEGVEKGGKHVLPGIQEDDVQRSMDSITTLDSDSLILESLEADLFQDIRASIQISSKSSSIANSTSKVGSAETEAQTIHSSRNADLASRNKLKPKPASKKLSISTQGPGKMIKPSIVCAQVRQSAARSGESTAMLSKLPKPLGRANPISTAPTKRASLGSNRVKMEKDIAKNSTVAGRGAPLSKMSGSGISRNIVPRPKLSSKSSSSGSSTATKMEPTPSCSSLDSSGSASSNNVGKSPLNSMRRKIDSRTTNPTSSGSTLKTPSRIASRNKTQSVNSRVSAHLMSVTRLSSSISPASSISEWSSESSSTSTANQRFDNSKASPTTSSPHKGVSVDSDAPQTSDFQNPSNDQFPVEHEHQMTGLQSRCVNGTLTGTGMLPQPASAKPSGLRMPSPKIGFFDGVKSLVRTPKGGMHSHSGVPSGLPKSRASICSPSGDSNKAKLGKFQPSGTGTAVGNIKPESQQTALSTKPISLTPLREPLNASTKVSNASRAVRNCPDLSPKVQNVMSPKTGGIIQLKTGEAGAKGSDRAKYNPDLCFKKQVSPEVKEGAHLKDIEITPINMDKPSATCDSSSICNMDMQKELIPLSLSPPTSENTGSTATSEITASMRIPFSVKNSFCDKDELLDPSTGSTVEVVEKTATLPFLASAQKENS